MNRIFARLIGRLRRDAVVDDVREELESHVRARVDEYERAGFSSVAARRRARERFGDLDRHLHRGYAVRGSGVMETIWQDVKYGVRSLRRQPGFAALAMATLALGIGASTAIFSVIDAAMLRPLPYPAPEQLVRLSVEVTRADGRPRVYGPSMDDMRRWQGASDVFSHVAGWSSVFSGRILEGPEPRRVSALEVTEDYLALHGIAPIHGRAFNLDDTRVGAPAVILVGYGYWQSRYGGDPAVVGTTLTYDDAPATIIGVLPAGFYRETPLWRPLIVPADLAATRATGRVTVMARLRPGIDRAAAAERLAAIVNAPAGPDAPQVVAVRLNSLLDAATSSARTTVSVMAGAVGLILLIACVNVAGLLLVRGATRQAELAIRASLGAGRLRLVRQMLTESVVLALAGGLAGVALAWISLDALVTNVPMTLPANSPVQLNVTVLAASLALTALTGILFGLIPALRLSGVRLNAVLARGSKGQGGSVQKRVGQTLIAVEIALALVLVAGAGLMIRSFMRIGAVDLGFDPGGILTMETQPIDASLQPAFYPALLASIRSMPGVTAAGAVNYFPLSGGASYSSVTVDGKHYPLGFRTILPGYLEAMGVAVTGGRLPTPADQAAGIRGVVLNETALKQVFPDGAAIGRTIGFGGAGLDWQVLGTVADVRHGGPMGEAGPEVYVPFQTEDARPGNGLLVVIRTDGGVRGLGDRLRLAAQSVGPPVLIERIRTGDDWFGDRVITPRRRMVLLSLLGGLGLLLALVGIFGVTAYAVARRTREIGLRMAFGARAGHVVGTMLRDAVWPVAIGLAAGLTGAAFATKIIASFLFETTPTDVPTFVAVAIALAATAMIAAWIPARRAARVDPVMALRAE